MKAIIRIVHSYGNGEPVSKEIEYHDVGDFTVNQLLEELNTETYANDILEIQFLDFK